MNPATPASSPKTRFLMSGVAVGQHRAMVGTDTFIEGADAAMLQYVERLTATAITPNEAMSIGLRIAGAQEFLMIFKTLGETPRQPAAAVSDNLNPKA